MSMGNSWSYVETDTYKSTNRIIHLLVDIVAKGGNYLLNVGPSPEGTLPPTAIERMHEIGQWMKANGNAIYGTRPIYPYVDGKIRFTQKGDKVYAIYLLDENETLPEQITFDKFFSLKTGKIKVLGSNKKATLSQKDGHYCIQFDADETLQHAVVFEMKKK